MRPRGSFSSAALVAVVMLALFGCSDDTGVTSDKGVDRGVDAGRDSGPKVDLPLLPCALKLATINGKSVAAVDKLTEGDDQDKDKAGIQLSVDVSGTGLPEGEEVRLSVTGLTPDPKAAVASGKASFTGVTISADLSTAAITAYSTKCSPSSATFGVTPPPECTFVDPPDGKNLAKKDDKDPATPAFEYDVKIATKNATGGKVLLTVGTATLPDKAPDGQGSVLFASTILAEGENQLKAEVILGAAKRTCTAKVTISTGAPKCTFKSFSPAAVDTTLGKKGLGLAQDAAPGTSGFQTDITFETDVDSVTLFVDGVGRSTVTAVAGTATFKAESLADGDRTVQATCANSSSGASTQSPPASVLVDFLSPEKVTTLSCTVSNNRLGELTCTWTAVADKSGGSGVEAVELRYTAGSAISASNWGTATKLDSVAPLVAGQTHTEVFKGLPLGYNYYIGLRSVDYVGNLADLATPTATPLNVDFKKEERPGIAGAKGWGGIMAAGDFDCDGYTDLAVGDPEAESSKGMVYIYLGSLNGLSVNPIKLISGTVAGGMFGARLAALPNFDNDADKCTDLAVYASHGETNKGQVFIYLGRKFFFDREDVTTGIGAELILQLPAAAAATELLAGGMASAGDFDHDGATDLALSHADTGADTAEILVVYGDAALTLMTTGQAPVVKELPAAAGVQISGGKASDAFGQTLAGGALLDTGDHADLLIGAKDTQEAATKRGAVYVVKGDVRAGTLPEVIALASSARVIAIKGGTSNTSFGAALAFVGDMDKDGTPEFAVGDPSVSSFTGAVYLFNLKGTAPATVADAVTTVTNDVVGPTNDKFGIAIAGAAGVDPALGADFNGDQMAELIAGSESLGTSGVGAVFEIGGADPLTGLATSKAKYTFKGPAGALSFGTVVILAPDINGDGYVDVIIGDPLASSGVGRFFAYY